MSKAKIFTLDKATMPHQVRFHLTLLREDPLKSKKKLLAESQLEVEFAGEEAAQDCFKMLSYVLAGWEKEIQSKAAAATVAAKDSK